MGDHKNTIGHKITIGALAFLMAVAWLAWPKCGFAAGYTSWARSEVAVGDGMQLKLTKFEKQFRGNDYSFIGQCPGYSTIPDQMSQNSTSHFCYGSFHPPSGFFEVDTGFFFYYDIQIPDGSGGWKASGYYVDAATKVPLFGDPIIECTIKQSGSTAPANGPPFRCDTSFTGKGNDSEPHWKISAKPLQVIDASVSSNVARAAQLIGENCQQFDTIRCEWTRTQTSSAFLADRKDWQPLTDWGNSCPPTDPSKPFVLNSSRSVQISWSDKVGGKLAGKVAGDAFLLKVEATVEVNYEHSIAQTDTWTRGYTYTIPYNYRSALYLQHGMLQVTGDFSIVTGTGDRFLVKNAIFIFPLEKEVQVEGRGQPIPHGNVEHVDILCSQTAPAVAGPPPGGAKVGTAAEKTQ